MNSCLECKHYKRSERIGVKCCELGIQESYCEKDKEDFAIGKLEKVRAKIIKKANSGQWSEPTIYGMRKAVFIIDNELSELKGENNAE